MNLQEYKGGKWTVGKEDDWDVQGYKILFCKKGW